VYFLSISAELLRVFLSHAVYVVVVLGAATLSHTVTDEFKLGDGVWVSGVKKGVIAYIGETQFAPGVWAGILLEEPIGKNDGSVGGVRYFACEPLHGIFAKLNTLTSCPVDSSSQLSRVPIDTPVSDGQLDSKGNVKVNDKDTSSVTRRLKLPASSLRPSGLARLSRSNTSSSNSSLSVTALTPNESRSEANATTSDSQHVLKVGQRVVIGGNKTGTLRYFGATHFAKGEWAGIELDEPIGKNDGSVEGRR